MMIAHTYPERVRGNTVRACTGHMSVPFVTVTRHIPMIVPTYPEMVKGNTVHAWTGHRSVRPVTVTNIRSCVIYDLFFYYGSHNIEKQVQSDVWERRTRPQIPFFIYSYMNLRSSYNLELS